MNIFHLHDLNSVLVYGNLSYDFKLNLLIRKFDIYVPANG